MPNLPTSSAQPPQFPITLLPTLDTGSIPLSAYLQTNLIYVSQVNGSGSVEILELFSASKEVFYVFPDTMVGQYYGTYLPVPDQNATYILNKSGTKVGYANTVIP